MTLTMARHTYGVQVGNETYSLVVTDDDWEKRKLEKERQKRLSQETNRRRKALEEKKKLAEEREARKRALQLSKRKQRQTEATERYQRAHIMAKHANKSKDKKNLPLDDVLQQLRSGSTEINYIPANTLTESTTKKPTIENTTKTETTLKEKQQRILHEHKLYTAKEFYNELGNHSSPTPYLSNNIRKETPDQSRLYNDNVHKNSYRPVFSNVDLMSGQTVNQNYSAPLTANNYYHLPEAISKLFIRQSEDHKPMTSARGRYEAAQLQLEDAEDVVQSPIMQPKVYDNSTSHNFATSSPKCESLVQNDQETHESEFPDDQDSLHGSNSSRNSPVPNLMTSFHKKHADESELVRESQARNPEEKSSPSCAISPNLVLPPDSFKMQSHSPHSSMSAASDPASPQATLLQQHPPISAPQAFPNTIANHVPPSNYYVKSYRSFSATENRDAVEDEKAVKPRPKSSISHRSTEINPTQPRSSPHSMTDEASNDTSLVSANKREPPLVKTPATPISDLYSDAWTKTISQPKTTMAAVQSTSTSVAQATVDNNAVSSKEISFENPPKIVSATTHDVNTEQISSNQKFKSILRKKSKYDSPHYHNAAAAARLKWVEHMNANANHQSNSSKPAKLHDTEVRDSLDVNRNGSARSKSVRWHEIQFDDGTSATLTEASVATQKPVIPVNQSVKTTAEKSFKNRPSSAKVRPRPPSESEKPAKKPAKFGRNRKYRAPTKLHPSLSPHPPPVEISQKTSQISRVSSSRRSRDQEKSISADDAVRKPVPYRIAWASDEKNKVTLNNLKSCGSPSPTSSPSRKTVEEPKVDAVFPTSSAVNICDQESPTDLNKTPTDQEINWLWDKVRNCMAQRPVSRGIPISKTLSDSGLTPNVDQRSLRRPSPTSQQPRASVVSIDGAMFSDNVVQSRSRRLARPSSAVMASAKQRLRAYNASIRRQALLQHRRNKQFAPNRMKNDLIAGPRRYPTPRMSYFDPYPSSRGQRQIDESTTAFLLAETLAEQNMTEEQIVKAMESLQRKTKEARDRKTEVNPSSLSIEEHRLLQSLERLNTRLHEVESAVSANPNYNYFNKALVTNFLYRF